MKKIGMSEVIEALVSAGSDVKELESYNEDMMFEDAGFDSLDMFGAYSEIASQYGVTVPDEMADQLKSFGELIDYLNNELEKVR